MARDVLVQNVTLAADSVPDGFSPSQVLAMAALLSGKTKTTAARLAGVSRNTIHRWLADDAAFVAYYNSARKELADATEQSLRLLAPTAVKSLRILLTRRRVADAIKLKAAVEVLRLMSKPIEGPTDSLDAEHQITRRQSAREQESDMCASITRRMKEKKDLEERIRQRQT